MTDKYVALENINQFAHLDDTTLKAASRELFKRLPMIRAFDSDYDNAVALLRQVYNLGRCRGVNEGKD